MAENVNLIKFLNEFDNSASLSAGFSEKNFEAISKALQTGTEEERAAAATLIPAKVKNLIKIVSKTVERLNATIASKFPGLKQLDLEKSITFNASSMSGKFEIIEVGNEQHISFNVKKLAKLPALEVSAIITKSVIDALAKQNNKENDNTFYKTVLLYGIEDDSHVKTKEEKDILKAKNIISGYLLNFLPAVYADDFEKFFAISNYVAKQIIEDLGEKDIENILNPFFDLELLDIKGMAIDKVDAFLGNTHQARLSHLNKRAQDLLADSNTEVLGLSYLEQVESILGTDSSDPNYSDLSRKFETMSNGEKCLSGAAVKEFCLAYVNDFMAKRNLKNVKVSFNEKGALGTYIESEHRININLKKLQKIGSYTELAMTISHEMTHAADAAKGITEGYGGLKDDISEKFKHTTDNADVNDFIKKLLKISYKVNPNERSARLGEISALMFMAKNGSKNPSIQAELKKSVSSFKNYQTRTINIIKKLPETYKELETELNGLIGSGALIERSPLHREIEERMKYISDFGLNASIEEELKSIEYADLILSGEQGLEEIRRREQAAAAQREEENRRIQEEKQNGDDESLQKQ